MKRLSLSEIKILQIEILNEVSAFCEKNQINYSLSFGTLLGAVRHKGYIPWDDDIDIMMLRPDYNKFISSFKSINNIYRVKSILNDTDYPYPFAKVEYSKSSLIEFSDISYEIGVYIDIFPVDGIPTKKKVFNNYFNYLKFLKDILLVKTIKINFNKRSILKNLILFFLKIIFKFISYKTILKFINKKLSSSDYEESEYLMTLCFPAVKKHHKLKREIFQKFTYIDFEKGKYKSIKDYDKYLNLIYGNYMELPKANNRVSHHSFEAFLK